MGSNNKLYVLAALLSLIVFAQIVWVVLRDSETAVPAELTVPVRLDEATVLSVEPGGAPASGSSPQASTPPSPAASAPPATEPPLLEGTARLSVLVVDHESQPWSDVAVRLEFGRWSAEKRSDGEGAVTFLNLAPGAYRVAIEVQDLPRLTSGMTVTLMDQQARELLYRIAPHDQTLSGRTLDDAGQPIPGIVVEARRNEATRTVTDLLPDSTQLRSTSDEEGHYLIEPLISADYLVFTHPTPRYPRVQQVFRAGVQSADLHLQSAEEVRIVARVVDTNGGPLSGVRVAPLGFESQAGLTDERGEVIFDFGVISLRRTVVLVATHEDYRTMRSNVRLDERDDGPMEVDIQMEPWEPRVAVSGVVTDRAGEGVGGETLMLYSRSRQVRYVAITDEDGSFVLDQVEVADDYRLSISPRSGFIDHSEAPLEITPQGLELEIVLVELATGQVAGRMVDPEGSPVVDFRLALRSRDAQVNTRTVTSDEDGRFVVEEMPAGALIFETRASPRFVIQGYELAADGDLDVVLPLDWGSRVMQGIVTNIDGEPIVGARVNLFWDVTHESVKSTSFRSAVTDADGRYTFSELAAGTHRLQVTARGFRSTQLAHDVGLNPAVEPIRLRVAKNGR